MGLAYSPSIKVTRSRELPPTAPLPPLVQTVACRLRPLEYLEWCRSHIGPRFTVKPVSMPPLVFLTDPSDIRAVVTAPLTVLHSGVGAAITAPLFGETSFMLREEDERLHGREAIMPAFHRQAVAEYTDMVADLAGRAVAEWPHDTPIPIHPHLCVLTLTVMLRTVFGDSDDLTVGLLRGRMLSMLSVTASLVLQEPRLHHLPGWRRTWSQFMRERDAVDKLIARIIARRRCTGGSGDMLDMLLDTARLDGLPMTARELRDNLVAVIIAGHETTASALAWALQLLAHHPRVQDQLAAEVDSGESDDYMRATVSEILRHRPVFLFTAPRAVTQPIEIGGWTYNPPAHLLGCVYLMHHNPELFPDPHDFRPERFLDSRSRAARMWLPWGGGRQRCPGRHLALLELQTVLRTVLGRRRVLPASSAIERARWRSVIVTPHAGGRIVLRERNVGSRRSPSLPAGRDSGHFRADCSEQNAFGQP
jgi:cytochrome P450